MPKISTYIYVTPFFPSQENWRGAYGYDFVCALMSLGANVFVFVPGKGSDYDFCGVRVHRFQEWKLPSSLFPFLFRKRNERSFLSAVKKVVSLDEVSVCHGNTAEFVIYPLALKAMNPQCRTLLHHHDLQSFGLNGGRLRHCWLYNLYLFPCLRHLHEQVDCHVFVSEASRRSFLAAPDATWTRYEDYRKQMRWLPYRPAKIKNSVILHNGVNQEIFKPLPVGRTRSTGDFVIGCIANFDELKDQMTLLQAVAILARERPSLAIRVVFVGSGPTLRRCRQFARDTGLRVEFKSEVQHEKLVDFYHQIDLFVLPSWFEGFGCVYVEAWACGVPFVGCEGQGIEDLVLAGEKEFSLVRPEDPIALAGKIRYHISHSMLQHLKCEIEIKRVCKLFLDSLEVI